MDYTINQRFTEAVDYLIKNQLAYNQVDLAKKMHVSRSIISDFKSYNKAVSEQYVLKMCDAFPVISRRWIMTGEGIMLKEDVAEYKQAEDVNLVPLLPISAQGGSLNGFVVSVKENDCERIVSPIRGVDFAITVAGDSMAPEYPAGSQILIKRINERAFIDWGKVYVLDTCNGSVIKRILPSDDTNKVRCVSINPDYPPFEVAFEDIYGIYRVLLCMSVK